MKTSPPGKIAPLLCADNAARLHPAIIRIHIRDQIRAGSGLRANLFGGAHPLDNLRTQAVDLQKIRAHAFQHDLLIDVDHVGVADLAAVHDVGHLHARLQFVSLRLHGEDADLAGLKIGGDHLRKIRQGTRCHILQHPGAIRAAHCFQFAHQRGRDFQTCFVRDNGHFFGGLYAQAHAHSVARAGRQLGIKRQVIQLSVGLWIGIYQIH